MAIVVNKDSKEYITKNPIRSSIGAVGFGAVNAINLGVDVIETTRDVVKLAKLSIQTSVIEAEEENVIAQLESFDRIEALKAQLANKKAGIKA